jgi:hypothetical protein
MEADIAFLDDPDAHKADLVDGAIGELSSFHEMYAYYAQGVEVSTAILPDGWHDRVVPFVPTSAEPTSAEPATAVCLEPHDLVVSKLAAMREKDRIFGVGTGRRAPRGPHRQRLRRAVTNWLTSLARRDGPQPYLLLEVDPPRASLIELVNCLTESSSLVSRQCHRPSGPIPRPG